MIYTLINHLLIQFLQNLIGRNKNFHVTSLPRQLKSQDSSRVKWKQIRGNDNLSRISTTSFEKTRRERHDRGILMRVRFFSAIQVSLFNGRRFDGGGRFFSVQSRRFEDVLSYRFCERERKRDIKIWSERVRERERERFKPGRLNPKCSKVSSRVLEGRAIGRATRIE